MAQPRPLHHSSHLCAAVLVHPWDVVSGKEVHRKVCWQVVHAAEGAQDLDCLAGGVPLQIRRGNAVELAEGRVLLDLGDHGLVHHAAPVQGREGDSCARVVQVLLRTRKTPASP